MHNRKINFGKHKGELWTRIPLSYLRWCVNENVHEEEARAELERRGSSELPKLELSNHAIDRASLRLRKMWYQDTNKNVGLWTWLHGLANEAYEKGKVIEENNEIKKVIFRKIKMHFSKGACYPTLLTVINKNK